LVKRPKVPVMALVFASMFCLPGSGSPASKRPAGRRGEPPGTESSGGPATTAAAGSAPSGAVSGCLRPPASCYTPRVFRVAYGIQPLLDGGIDGRGETVTVLAPASASAALWGGLMALADQDAHHGLGFVNPAIYRIARSSSYHKAFHDITTGSNKLAMPSVSRASRRRQASRRFGGRCCPGG
jgi:hypothetical protein